jgi:cell filamentation protein
MEQNQTSQYSPEYIDKWNSYFDLDNDVLKNKLGIEDQDELEKKSAEISVTKLAELYLDPIKGDFDSEHLCAIHRYIFDDLYDWAGEYRTIYMKKDNQTTLFAPVDKIQEMLDKALVDLKIKILNAYNKMELATALGTSYIAVQHVHPFREGNSRTIREFFRQFVLEKTPLLPMGPMELDLTAMNPDIMATARKYVTASAPGEIVLEFYKALKPVTLEQTSEIKK